MDGSRRRDAGEVQPVSTNFSGRFRGVGGCFSMELSTIQLVYRSRCWITRPLVCSKGPDFDGQKPITRPWSIEECHRLLWRPGDVFHDESPRQSLMSSLILKGQAFTTSFLSTFFRLGIEQHRINQGRIRPHFIHLCTIEMIDHESLKDPKQWSTDITVSETAMTTGWFLNTIYKNARFGKSGH